MRRGGEERNQGCINYQREKGEEKGVRQTVVALFHLVFSEEGLLTQ